MPAKNMIRSAVPIIMALLLVTGIGLETQHALANSEFSLGISLLDRIAFQQVKGQCAGTLHRSEIHIRSTTKPEFGYQVNCKKSKITLTYPEYLVGSPISGYAGYVLLEKPNVEIHYSIWEYSTREDASSSLFRWKESLYHRLQDSQVVSKFRTSVDVNSVEFASRDKWGLPRWQRAILRGNTLLTIDIYELPQKLPMSYIVRIIRSGQQFHPDDVKDSQLFSDKMFDYLKSIGENGKVIDIPFSNE